MPCINLQRTMASIRKHLLSCCGLKVSLLSPDEVSIVQSFEHLDFGFLFVQAEALEFYRSLYWYSLAHQSRFLDGSLVAVEGESNNLRIHVLRHFPSW